MAMSKEVEFGEPYDAWMYIIEELPKKKKAKITVVRIDLELLEGNTRDIWADFMPMVLELERRGIKRVKLVGKKIHAPYIDEVDNALYMLGFDVGNTTFTE
jgi:hypothetical protein